MVLTESDSDIILVEAMKNCSSGEMIWVYQKLINRLHATGIAPKHHILDKECSDEFKETIKCNEMAYQLVPPHDYRRNHAKRAIQTFKDHFVAILCRADKEFPLNLWDLLLPQAENTLDMLHLSWMTPTVLAYTYLWGQHDYNSNPFAPLGCKVEIHLVPGIIERRGHNTRQVDSTLAIHGSIISATMYSSVTHVIHGFAAQYFSSTNTSLCPD
jgi:hypothetical protein